MKNLRKYAVAFACLSTASSCASEETRPEVEPVPEIVCLEFDFDLDVNEAPLEISYGPGTKPYKLSNLGLVQRPDPITDELSDPTFTLTLDHTLLNGSATDYLTPDLSDPTGFEVSSFGNQLVLRGVLDPADLSVSGSGELCTMQPPFGS